MRIGSRLSGLVTFPYKGNAESSPYKGNAGSSNATFDDVFRGTRSLIVRKMKYRFGA